HPSGLIQLPPQQAEEHIVRLLVFGVVLEAGALEVLNDVGVAIGPSLLELIREWQADDEYTQLAPGVEEATPNAMPGLLDTHRFYTIRRSYLGENPSLHKLAAEQTQEHLVLRALVLRVPLEAGALEPLDDVLLAVGWAGLQALARDGISKEGQAAIVLPIR